MKIAANIYKSSKTFQQPKLKILNISPACSCLLQIFFFANSNQNNIHFRIQTWTQKWTNEVDFIILLSDGSDEILPKFSFHFDCFSLSLGKSSDHNSELYFFRSTQVQAVFDITQWLYVEDYNKKKFNTSKYEICRKF